MHKVRVKKELIGEALIKAGLITPRQLKFALEEQQNSNGSDRERIGEILIKKGFVEERVFIYFLEQHLGVPYANIEKDCNIDLKAVRMIPEAMARQLKVIPLRIDLANKKLIVAMYDPLDIIALDTLRAKTGYEIERRFTQGAEIDEMFVKLYEEEALKRSIHDFIDLKLGSDKTASDETASKVQLEIEAIKTPVIEFVDHLLYNAVQERASDIHLEPCSDELRIRYRIDGMLHDVTPPPKEMQSAIISRLKVLSSMDIAERRLPQDGRFKFMFKDKLIDVRVASTPVTYGEKLVLRILDSTSILVKLEELGMDEKDMDKFKSILAQSYGMILVTGPTGSGKTTTLYSAIKFINTSDKNIVTIEDPVEYQLHGINQIQTKPKIGLTFASSLRTVLRQDPDIIMIGEIRDLETLQNAVKASLTGHLVLSTLHTNSAPNVAMRLTHMGLEPYLTSSCLSLVIGQRLVRRICEHCKEEIEVPSALLKKFQKESGADFSKTKFYKGKGCKKCGNTGYKGRTGIFEFFVITEEIRNMIVEGASEPELKRVAEKNGMVDILHAGLEKAKNGITTLDEVLRVSFLENIH